MRIQEFSPSRVGGGRGSSKKPRQRFLLFLLFLVLTINLFNSFTEVRSQGLMVYFWKTIIFQGSRGRPTFYGVGEGSNFFPGGGGGGGGGGASKC